MRVYVDGMNVIGSLPDGWWRDRHAAMVRLVGQLDAWAQHEEADVVVDARALGAEIRPASGFRRELGR